MMGMNEELFDGVVGYTVDMGENGFYVPFLMSLEEGKGNVSKYIEHLKAHHPVVKFPNLISLRLKNMLIKRGFKLTYEKDERFGEMVDVYVWNKESEINE